jgi:hypothetical protein
MVRSLVNSHYAHLKTNSGSDEEVDDDDETEKGQLK